MTEATELNETTEAANQLESVVRCLDFGDYCLIEQKRYGCENEMFLYKVTRGGIRCNYWRGVPVDANQPNHIIGKTTDVIQAIRCGVDETKVETFRLCDVKPNTMFRTSSTINFNEAKINT